MFNKIKVYFNIIRLKTYGGAWVLPPDPEHRTTLLRDIEMIFGAGEPLKRT